MIGHAYPPLVEHDQPAEGAEPVEEGRMKWKFPHDLEMGNHVDVDDVDRALAHHLVRDVDVATPRITRLRLHTHSVALHPLPCD
jgi:hypothetical protein